MEGLGYDLTIFAPARLVSPGTSGQGRGCIDMTAPFCGQTRTRGAGRVQLKEKLGTLAGGSRGRGGLSVGGVTVRAWLISR